MPRPLVRRGLAIAVAVTTAAIAGAASPTIAYADHGGTGDVLSAGVGPAITFSDRATMPLPSYSDGDNIAWSPDGSRVAFIQLGSQVASYRYDSGGYDGTDASLPTSLVQGISAGFRDRPTWSADGSTIYYSERVNNASRWTINWSISAPGWDDHQLTPHDGYDYFRPNAGPRGVLVAERQDDDGHGDPEGNPMVVAINEATGAVTPIIAGQQPVVSPDGARVAFLVSDNVHYQIWASNLTGGDLVQITADAQANTHPTWSPDGKTIAFTTDGGVATASADGSDAANPTMAAVYGQPAYVPQVKDHVVELAGTDRFATAIAISQSHWATAGASGDGREAAQSVTLSRSDTFADAISGSALAAAKHGPLLMTPPANFNAGIKAEIQRVLGSGTSKTVYILGSTSAISPSTETAIKKMGYQTKRLAGADRYATSIAIAKAISTAPQIVLTATGRNFPDALGASAAAGSYNAFSTSTRAVVVLTNDTAMPAATGSYLDNWNDTVPYDDRLLCAVGNQANSALANAGWSNYPIEAGTNRYETASKVALDFFAGELSAGVTTGLNWPDALAGGALLGSINGPLLLTGNSSTLDATSASILDSSGGSIGVGYVFGSTLPTAINGQIGSEISGPGGYDSAMPAATPQPAQATSPHMLPTIAQIEARAHMKGAATLNR